MAYEVVGYTHPLQVKLPSVSYPLLFLQKECKARSFLGVEQVHFEQNEQVHGSAEGHSSNSSWILVLHSKQKYIVRLEWMFSC